MTVSDDTLIASYARHGNVWKVGAEVGLGGGTVHKRLKELGVQKPMKVFTRRELAIIRAFYEQTPPSQFDLDVLCKAIDRPKTSVARIAKTMNLTYMGRPKSDRAVENNRLGSQGKWSRNPHPRGALGITHSEDTRAKIGRASKELWRNAKLTGTSWMSEERLQLRSDWMSQWSASRPAEKGRSRANSGARDDLGGLFVRSSWEANYARYLNWLVSRGQIESWRYEPTTFWFHAIKRGARSYKPDFLVTEKGAEYYVELKGWMDARSKTCLSRMAKYYPDVDLRLVDATAYRAIEKSVSSMIPHWERAAGVKVQPL